MKRILIFSLAYMPYVGGAEVAVKEICDRLPDDWQIDLITLRFDKRNSREERIGRVRVFRVGNRSKYLFPIFAALKGSRLHLTQKYTCVWSIMANYAGFAALFFKWFHSRVPFLLTLQEGDPPEHILKRVGIFLSLFKRIFKSADYVQTISQYLAGFAREMGYQGLLDVVPNGVDLKKFESRKLKVESAKKENIVLITTSRLVRKNGVDTIVDAMKYLPPNVSLWILGEGNERADIELRIKDYELGSRVKLFGEIDQEKLPDYLGQADIFVRPSRSEGLGNSFLEAMATGLPVVGTSVGGIPDFLIDGETGVFAKPDDPENVAYSVQRLIDDDELRKRVIQRGEMLVKERYDWNKIATKFADIFQSLRPSIRLVLAAPLYPPNVGGPAIHAFRYGKEFPLHGVQVFIVAHVGFRPIYLLRVLFASFGKNLIYANDVTASGFSAYIAKKVLGIPYALRIGGDLVWERAVASLKTDLPMSKYYEEGHYLSSPYYSLSKRALQGASAIIVPATNLASLYATYYGVSEDKIFLIPNPIPALDMSLDKDREIGSGSKKIVLFAGRQVRYKNLDRIKRAVSRISNAEFKCISDVSHEEVSKEIRRASLCIAPAWTEFSPNFILECVSEGKPVLVSREHGLSLSLSEEMLIDPFDDKDIERKLRVQLDHPTIVQAPKWSWGDVVKKNIEIIEKISNCR